MEHFTPFRVIVIQPNANDPYHYLNGNRGIVTNTMTEPNGQVFHTVFFTEGSILSMVMHGEALQRTVS